MKFDSEKHHRRSIRLKGYDYSQNGAYFITICSRNRECIFGEVNDRLVELSEYGKIIKKCWLDIPNHYPSVLIDDYIIMPNHIHGIIIIRRGLIHQTRNRNNNNDCKQNQMIAGMINHAPTNWMWMTLNKII